MKSSMLKIAIVGLFITSCGGEKPANNENAQDASRALKVFTVNYPLYYFAQKIGGEYVELIFPIPADIDPAYWEPKNSMNEIQSADLILANGAGYAKWMEKVSLPSSKIVDSSKGFSDKYIEINEGVTHSHGGDGEHSHSESAFTTWLDFKLAIQQATAVKEALVRLLPDKASELNRNFNGLKGELRLLDERMETLAKDIGDEHFIGSHPVYQYLSLGYSLDIISLHWEPNEMPSADQWQVLEKLANDNQNSIMIWEGPPMNDITTRLSEMNLQTVIFEPCGNKPGSGDFISVMQANINLLERAFLNK